MITDDSSVVGGGAPIITPNGRKLDCYLGSSLPFRLAQIANFFFFIIIIIILKLLSSVFSVIHLLQY